MATTKTHALDHADAHAAAVAHAHGLSIGEDASYDAVMLAAFLEAHTDATLVDMSDMDSPYAKALDTALEAIDLIDAEELPWFPTGKAMIGGVTFG